LKVVSLLLLPAALLGAAHFEPNRGQAPARFAFVARTASGVAAIAADGVELRRKDGARGSIRLDGASRAAMASGVGALPAVSHYARGRDPRRWLWDIPHYGRARFRSVYPGIDVEYHAERGAIEFDFLLAPDTDPARIRLRLGAAARLTAAGELIAGATALHAPRAWQFAGGARVPVDAQFTLERGRAGIRLGRYDRSLPLVIDPVIDFATYLGGSDNEWDTKLAVGADGAIFVAGTTQSADFPASLLPDNPLNRPEILLAPDAYVARLKPDGSALEWSFFLGGSGEEGALGLRRDDLGNLYLLGGTSSPNFPVTPGAFHTRLHPLLSDLFVVKLDAATGRIKAATYLGVGQRTGARLAVDPSGGVYVAGITGQSFATTPGAFQPKPAATSYQAVNSFALRLNAALTAPVYATYLNTGTIAGLDVDAVGNIAFGGTAFGCIQCGGPPFVAVNPLPGIDQKPTSPAQAYVAKLNATGAALVFSTLLHGGGNSSMISDLKLAADGAIHVIGYNSGAGFPQVNPIALDLPANTPYPTEPVPFWAKLAGSGASLLQSTLFYGPEYQASPSLAFPAPLRLALLAGGAPCLLNMASAAFQQTPGALLAKPDIYGHQNGGSIACADAAGSRFTLKTYLAPTGSSGYVETASTADGALLLAGTSAAGITTTPNAAQPVFGGGANHDLRYPYQGLYGDAFIMRISTGNPTPRLLAVAPESVLLQTNISGTRSVDLYGAGFSYGSDVTWNGKTVPSDFVDAGHITLPKIDFADIQAGANQVQVSMAGPGGGATSGVLTGINATPTIVTVSPQTVNQGAPETKLVVRSDNLRRDATLYWNGVPRAAQFVADSPSSGGHFELLLAPSELAQPLTARVTVGLPAPGGGMAPEALFAVVAPGTTLPVVNSPTNPPIFGGTPPLGSKIGLTGSGFASSTRIFWDGSEIPVEFVSATRINVQPPAADLARWGGHTVYAMNGALRSTDATVYIARSVSSYLAAADPVRRKLYAIQTVYSNPQTTYDLAILDLATGEPLQTVAGVANSPQAMVVSTDGAYLYIADGGSSPRIRRYNVDAGAFDPDVTLAYDPYGSSLPALVAIPGSPQSVIFWNAAQGVTIYDNGQARPNGPAAAGFKTGDSPVFATASRIYLNAPTGACWQWMEFDASGITGGSPNCSPAAPPDAVRDGAFLYLTDGDRTYPVWLPQDQSSGPYGSRRMIADVPHRVVYVTAVAGSSARVLQYNLDNQQLRLLAQFLSPGSPLPGAGGGILYVTSAWAVSLP
jgi:hypothetical protein